MAENLKKAAGLSENLVGEIRRYELVEGLIALLQQQ